MLIYISQKYVETSLVPQRLIKQRYNHYLESVESYFQWNQIVITHETVVSDLQKCAFNCNVRPFGIFIEMSNWEFVLTYNESRNNIEFLQRPAKSSQNKKTKFNVVQRSYIGNFHSYFFKLVNVRKLKAENWINSFTTSSQFWLNPNFHSKRISN